MRIGAISALFIKENKERIGKYKEEIQIEM